MTEKLTYDPTPADAPELNEDEQKSLEVAEKFRFRLDKIKGLVAIPYFQGFKWIRIDNTKANYIISIITYFNFRSKY